MSGREAGHRHRKPVVEVYPWGQVPKWLEGHLDGLAHGGDEDWVVLVRCVDCAPWIFDVQPDDLAPYVEGLGWAKVKRFGRDGLLIVCAHS